MSIEIKGLSVPENCFRCFASHWYDFGGKDVGFQCKALPMDNKIISNCEGRTKRRDDCPLVSKNTCKKCEDWQHERLWIDYKFCPYCGRVLDI